MFTRRSEYDSVVSERSRSNNVMKKIVWQIMTVQALAKAVETAHQGRPGGARERAKQTLIGCGVDLQGVVVHHDQDPVLTGYGWTGLLTSIDLS